MDWFFLAQDKDRLRVAVNAVTKVKVSYNGGNVLTG
jgi:hypothetical protein